MPLKKKAWSSWNSISNGKQTSVTYWLNNLQNLKSDNNFFQPLLFEENVSEVAKKIKELDLINITPFELMKIISDIQKDL